MEYTIGTNMNSINDKDVKKILDFAKDALEGNTEKTDPNVKLIKEKGKSDETIPTGKENE